MILWVVLFFLVIAISFVLAFRSMRDFQFVPQKTGIEYGLFLIRNSQGVTLEFLNDLRDKILQKNLIISFERLFKGPESALVIFGPKDQLTAISSNLNLLELEDYSLKVDENQISAWELGLRDLSQKEFLLESPLTLLAQIQTTEQFWWQINLKIDSSKENLDKSKFLAQIRGVFLSADDQRRREVTNQLVGIGAPSLTKVPKPYTSEKILEFYQKRSLSLEKINPSLSATELLKAIALS